MEMTRKQIMKQLSKRMSKIDMYVINLMTTEQLKKYYIKLKLTNV